MSKVSRKNRLRLYHPPILHCMQIGEQDCGVACVAMLCGVNYTTAWEMANFVCPIRWEKWGLSSDNVCDMIASLVYREYRLRRLRYPRPSLVGFTAWPKAPCIAIIRDDADRAGHMVVYAPPHWIHDPEWHKRYRVEEYTEGMEASVRVIGFIERVQTDEPTDAA